jgi:hypothetical protein
VTDDSTSEQAYSTETAIPDPDTLRERPSVPIIESETVVPADAAEGVRQTYQACQGKVVVGVTDDRGRLLLQRHAAPAPIHGDVAPDENWGAAAARVVAELTGITITVEGPDVVVRNQFQPAPDADWEPFTIPTVSVRASLDECAPAFLDDPQPLDTPEHKYYDDGADIDLGWHVEVPSDVHPGYEEHVRRYLD